MDKKSKPYISGEYEDLFSAAETGNLACEDVVAYSQSLDKLREVQRAVDYERVEALNRGHYEGRKQGIKEGYVEGIVKGREEGIVKGREEEKLNLAANLKRKGLDLEFIADITSLPIDAIESL